MDSEQVSQIEEKSYPLYFGGLIMALIFFLLEETTIDLPDEVNLLFKLIAVFLLSLHFVSVFSGYTFFWKIIIIFTFLLSVVVGIKSDHLSQLYVTWAAVFGAKDIPKDKLLTVYFKVSFFFCVMTVCLALLGLIENYQDYNLSGTRENIFGEIVKSRGSYGYIWPTDFATHVFFIFMTYWIIKNGTLSLIKVFLFLFLTYMLLFYTDSRLGCGCIVLLLLCGGLLSVAKKKMEGKSVGSNRPRLSFLFVLWIPFLAFLSLWATAAYEPTNLTWIAIDLVLSGRLDYGQEALSNYGIPLLGQLYILRGGETDENLYNYIDSSYIQLFVIYGLCYALLIVLSYFLLSYQAYRRRDYVILVVVFVAGISGAIAQHFIQFFMNPLLLLLFTKDEKLLCQNRIQEYED